MLRGNINFLFILVCVLLFTYEIKAQSREHVSEAGVVTMTVANFDSLVNSHSVALVDFWATWCGPCLMQAPVIEEIKKEVGNKIFIGKLDIDKNVPISKRYNIRGIPALLIFKNGVVVEKLLGYQPKKILMASLQKYIN